MANLDIVASDILLPSPTSVSLNDTLLWTSDTGRTLAGTMVGDITGAYITVNLKWQMLTQEEFKILKNAIRDGENGLRKFFPLIISDLDMDMQVYRGAIAYSVRTVGDEIRYPEISVDLIERG